MIVTGGVVLGRARKIGSGSEFLPGKENLTLRSPTATNGNYTMMVYDDNLAKLKKWAARPDPGSYQQWCRDVLTANGIAWP